MAKFGPTGRFPYGKAGADDQGELRIGIAADHAHGVVRIAFGKPVDWIGVESGLARELAKILIERADELDQRKA